MTDESEKAKYHQTLRPETAEWLMEHYPEADNLQEAARMAISDARHFWDVLSASVGSPDE